MHPYEIVVVRPSRKKVLKKVEITQRQYDVLQKAEKIDFDLDIFRTKG
jgi:hypothetical protein